MDCNAQVPAKYVAASGPCTAGKIVNKNRRVFCGMAAAADESIGNVTRALEDHLLVAKTKNNGDGSGNSDGNGDGGTSTGTSTGTNAHGRVVATRDLLVVIAGDNGGMPGAAGSNFPLR